MKHLSKAFAFIALSAFMYSSCSEENPWSVGDENGGAIHLSLESDGSVLRSTRADDAKASIVPAPEEFRITLARTDGSSSQQWVNLTEFNKESTFPIGNYTLEAEFGDLETEGFTNPYYSASQNVSVTAGDEKNVNLRATLANSMVSIRYTDDFNAVYPQHSAAVRSEGHDYVVFGSDEIRPAYMCPSQISLNLTLTNSSGKQVTIQPAGFKAQPRRHYVVTIGVNGSQEQGNLQLDVQFEENVIAETVNVSLGDELFEADPPKVTAKDFTPGESFKSFENESVSSDPRFEVYAFGGLKEVNLTLVNSTYKPPFGKEVQLVNASSLDRSNVEAAGIEALGLFRNPDKMGIVKLKGLLEKLPVGTHTIQLEVVDAMTRRSDPMTFVAEVSPISVIITPAENVDYMSKDVVVYVSTNCPDIRNKSTFTVDEEQAEISSIETLSSAPITDIPANLSYHYRYSLRSKNELDKDEVLVELLYGSKEGSRTQTNVDMNFPDYSVEVDPMATLAKLRIVPKDPKMFDLIFRNLKIYNNGSDNTEVIELKTTNNERIKVILGLDPGTTYSNIGFSLSDNYKTNRKVISFTTETSASIPNGDFSESHQTLNISPIQVGGQYRVTYFSSHTIKSSIVRNEANEWASLNTLTCYSGSSNHNSWFLVPSTFVENNNVTIRTVGYNHAGKTPEISGGAAGTTYYCTNSPSSSDLNISRGEMFLGSYSYDGTEHRNDGIDFTSRPLSVSLKYKYTSVNKEVGEMLVKVLAADGTVLNTKSVKLEPTSQMKDIKERLSSYPFGKRAARLEICFKSTEDDVSPAIVIPTGSDLDEGQGLGDPTLNPNSYKAFAIGSVLEVSEVRFGYYHPNDGRYSPHPFTEQFKIKRFKK